MWRIDASRPARAIAAVVFGFEAAALIESLRAESKKTKHHFPTISTLCWGHKWVCLAVIGALALHLFWPPAEFYEKRILIDARIQLPPD